MAHVDLIDKYIKSIIQQHPGVATIKNDVILVCMTTIDLDIGGFEIIEFPTFEFDKITCGNDEYIDKSYAMASQLFNNMWLWK